MEKLIFKTAEELRLFLIRQEFFAIYDCSTEYGDVEIEHYSLLKNGESVSPECMALQIMHLQDEKALQIFDRFLNTGCVQIHPKVFTL